MDATYEYIAAITIFSLMIGFSLISVSSLSSTQLKIMYGEQLRPVAEKLLDKILLTPGYPENWGTNIYVNDSSLKDIGLSLGSGEMFEIDADKLQRLVGNAVENPLYISPPTLGNLTGIYSRNYGWKYGFNLKVISALVIENITSVSIDSGGLYKFRVKTYKGEPAPNAKVNAFFFRIGVYKDGKQYTFDTNSSVLENITNWRGEVEFNFVGRAPTLPPAKGSQEFTSACLIVTAKYYGLQSQNIWYGKGALLLSLEIYGQYLAANFTDVPDFPSFARHITHARNYTVIGFTTSLTPVFYSFEEVTNSEEGNVINRGGKSYRVYKITEHVPNDLMFVGLVVRHGNNYYFVFASRPRVPIALNYSSGNVPYAGIKTETVERLVRIGLNSYYVELTLWRTAE